MDVTLSRRTDAPTAGSSPRASPAISGAPRTGGPLERSLRILLAEDNAVNQMVAVSLLRKRGHRVTVAENGRDAVEALEREPFDLVLMDIQMPEMDGLEATCAIRERERVSGGHTPIVAVTAHALKGDDERCFAAGMDGYLTKPLKVSDLVRALVGVAESLDRKAASQQVPAFDEGGLLELFDGDEEFLDQMLAVFFDSAPKLLAEIGTAVAERDFPRISRASHTLAGVVSNFGAEEAVAAGRRLEALGRQGDAPPPALAEAKEACERHVEALSAAVQRFRARRAAPPPSV
jgi:two-component system, sensor histidine kinase and response regulator